MANTKRNKSRDTIDLSGDAPEAPKPVLVDYDGIISRAPGQDEIRHTASPYVYPWPEQGRDWLVLQPGLNIVDGAHWAFYVDKPQVAPLIKRDEIKVLDGLPSRESDLKDLIGRTCDTKALEALRDAINAGGRDLFDAEYLEDRAPSLLRAIERRMSSTNRLEYETLPYQIRDIKAGPARATGLGMGG